MEEQQRDILISRRSLFKSAGAGVLTILGLTHLPDGSLQVAYADEAGSTHFKVYALSDEEVPVLAIDLTNGTNQPVADMAVQATSLLNGAVATATTDDLGCAALNIRALSEDAEDADAPDYAACVTLRASKAGYRTFVETQRFVQSGVHANDQGVMPNTVQIPTQQDAGMPYLSCASLDGIDIQYFAQTIPLNSQNDAQHTLEARIENAGTSSWAAELVNATTGATVASGSANAQSGTATITLTGTWLDGAHGISGGDALSLVFYSGATSYTLPLGVTLTEVQLPFSPAASSIELSVGTDQTDKEKATNALPDFFFHALGDTFNLGLPFLPMELFVDSYGNFGISATLLSCPLAKWKIGQGRGLYDPGKDWKTFFDKSGGGWVDTFLEQMSTSIDRWHQAGGGSAAETGKATRFGASKVTGGADVTYDLTLQALGLVQDTSQHEHWLWHTDFAALSKFALKINYDQQLVICGIPVYWAFDFTASLLFKVLLGLQFRSNFEDFGWSHRVSEKFSTPLGSVIMFRAELGLTAGIGITGVASVGIRGYGYFQILVLTDSTSDYQLAHHYPRVTIEAGGGVQATVQVLLFKKTVELTNFTPKNLYDSDSAYDKKSEDASSAFSLPDARFGANALQATSGVISADNMEMVTDASLAQCAEFTVAAQENGVLAGYRFTGSTGGSSAAPGIVDPYTTAPEVAFATPTGGFGATSAAGAAGYNPLYGVRPTVQDRLWADAFSAPRPKVVKVGEVTYLLRLSVVQVDIADNENLEMVQDGACLFARAKNPEALVHLAISEDDGLLNQPEAGEGVAVAQVDGFDEEPLLEASADRRREVIDHLSRKDTVGQPVTATTVARSRLTISRRTGNGTTWSDPYVIDFALPTTTTEYMRINTWDVDFDAVAGQNGPNGVIYVTLSSIVRPYGEDQTYDNQFKQQFISILQVFPDSAGTSFTVGDVRSSVTSLASGNIFWHPRIALTRDSSTEDEYAMVFYYRTPVVSDTYGEHADYDSTELRTVEYCYWPDYDCTSYPVPRGLYFEDDIAPARIGEGTFRVKGYSADGSIDHAVVLFDWSVSASSGAGNDHDACTLFSMISAYNGGVLGTKLVSDVSFAAVGACSDSNDQLIARWIYTKDNGGNQERLLRAMTATWTVGSYAGATFEETWPIGTTANVLKFFTSDDGLNLYAARTMEGTAPTLAEDAVAALASGADVCATLGSFNSANASLEDATQRALAGTLSAGDAVGGEDVQQFQLLCAPFDARTGAYRDFFPLADLDMAPDFLVEAPSTDGYHSFIVGSITNLDANQLDMYHVMVPPVLGLQLEGAQAVTHLCMPGDTCIYQVRVSNVGNTPISGFITSIYDEDTGAFVGSRLLTTLSHDLVEDVSAVKPVYGEDGQPTGEYETQSVSADEGNVLWPGQTRSYRAFFTLPADSATGEVGFYAAVSNPIAYSTSNVSGMSAQSADDATLTCVDSRKRAITTCLAEESTVSLAVAPANYTTASGASGNDDAANPKTSAKTGDALSVAAAALAAAAVAAGGTAHAASRKEDEDAIK